MSNLHILIVEDESIIALELSQCIEVLGYNIVGYATNPKMAQSYLDENPSINLIIMDINLNANISGITLYQELCTDAKVIYITAYKDEETILSAISTDPLGYLIKPHNEAELNALLKLAQHKMQTITNESTTSSYLTLGESYFFDEKKELLYFNTHIVKLGSKELSLLKLLISAKGSLITFEIIEYLLWKDEVPSTSSIRTLIYRLRGKLEYKLIETVVGQGIKLNFH